MRPELELVRSHHERLDGSGYPRALSGDQIPPLVRIMSIMDVFDALTSERSYRPAWSTADALDHLIEHKGKLFDPQFVDAWVELLGSDRSVEEP